MISSLTAALTSEKVSGVQRADVGRWVRGSVQQSFDRSLTLAAGLGSAFFGELTVLLDSRDGLRTDEKKRHVYTANAIVDSDCMFINESDLDQLDRTRPGLKSSMRIFALKRAQRELFTPLPRPAKRVLSDSKRWRQASASAR